MKKISLPSFFSTSLFKGMIFLVLSIGIIFIFVKKINFIEGVSLFTIFTAGNAILSNKKLFLPKNERSTNMVKEDDKGIVTLDENKHIVHINEIGKKMLGYKGKETEDFCQYCSFQGRENNICNGKNCFLEGADQLEVTLHIKGEENKRTDVHATVIHVHNGMILILKNEHEFKEQMNKKIEKLITRSVFQAQERERKHLSRELHDGIGQSLYAILLNIELLKSFYQQKQDILPLIEKLQQMTSQTIEDVRSLSSEIRPSTLDDEGLVYTLKKFSKDLGKRFGIQMNFHYKDYVEERLPAKVETALYRIAQEALINASKYSKAERVDIVIEKRKEDVILSIIDYGEGFEYDKKGQGVGLYSMQERASLLGGELFIDSTIGKGTEVRVQIPMKQGGIHGENQIIVSG